VTLAGAFDLDISKLDASKYLAREQTLQLNESDADFVRRLCRRDGIGWFVRAGAGQDNGGKGTQPCHTLVLFDNAMKLTQASGHRDRQIASLVGLRSEAVMEWMTVVSSRRGRTCLAGDRDVSRRRMQVRLDQGRTGSVDMQHATLIGSRAAPQGNAEA
jgi:type VI secretion system secreted protein VgrG